MIDLSIETWRRLSVMFAPEHRSAAAQLLKNECAENLPLGNGTGPVNMERIRFAVLKLSDGDLERLRDWVEHAKSDSRDVLKAAGFGGDVTAHMRWRPENGNGRWMSPADKGAVQKQVS